MDKKTIYLLTVVICIGVLITSSFIILTFHELNSDTLNENDSGDEIQQLIPEVTRVDFKPDFSLDFIDTYKTEETTDDVNIMTIEDIKQYQFNMNSNAPDVVKDLLEETRAVDCSNSFEAVKDIWSIVRNFGKKYPYLGNDSEVAFRADWDEWVCTQYQKAMIYALADAQLRNWDVGNWSEIVFYPVQCKVRPENEWSGHASVITSFPNKDGTMTPYITDSAYAGWRKYTNDPNDDIIFEFENEKTSGNSITNPILDSCGLKFNSNTGWWTMYIEGTPKEAYEYQDDFLDEINGNVPEDFKDFIYFSADKINDMRIKIYSVYSKIIVNEKKDHNYNKILISTVDDDFKYYFCVMEIDWL